MSGWSHCPCPARGLPLACQCATWRGVHRWPARKEILLEHGIPLDNTGGAPWHATGGAGLVLEKQVLKMTIFRIFEAQKRKSLSLFPSCAGNHIEASLKQVSQYYLSASVICVEQKGVKYFLCTKMCIFSPLLPPPRAEKSSATKDACTIWSALVQKVCMRAHGSTPHHVKCCTHTYEFCARSTW